MKRITDPTFRYVPAASHESDPLYLLRKFRRIIRERKASERQAAEERLKAVVSDIKNRRTA